MLVSLLISCNTATDEDQMTVDPNSDELSMTPLIDSNTNWLVSCSVDDDCGESGRCACGSCVIPCSPMSSEEFMQKSHGSIRKERERGMCRN